MIIIQKGVAQKKASEKTVRTQAAFSIYAILAYTLWSNYRGNKETHIKTNTRLSGIVVACR